MSATYTSIDTLTIGQLGSQQGALSGDLPVLAAAPDLRPEAGRGAPQHAEPPAEEGHTDPAHHAPPAPAGMLPEAPSQSEPPVAIAPEVQAVLPIPQAQPVEQPAAPETPEWEEPGWATLLLDLETTLRPHARTIVLFVLVVLTCLTVVLMKMPAPTPVAIPPTDMVDSQQTPAVLNAVDAQEQLASDSTGTAAADELEPLDPMPALPQQAPTGARITAVGPPSLPQPEGWLAGATPSDGVGPIPPQVSPTKLQRVVTVEAQAPDSQPIRVAERPTYPQTGSSHSWSPAADSATPSGAPPVAELMPPSNK